MLQHQLSFEEETLIGVIGIYHKAVYTVGRNFNGLFMLCPFLNAEKRCTPPAQTQQDKIWGDLWLVGSCLQAIKAVD
jgi:hypothetical protein